MEINERSFGVAPLQVRDGSVHIFLVKHYSGSWLLPKGHAELNETPQQTAERELLEETGLSIERWVPVGPFVEQYRFTRGTRKMHKEVQYFVAWVSGEVRLQAQEVTDGCWEPLDCAVNRVSFQEMKELIRSITKAMQSLE
jgi:8-oxo-dGTP pyrophosphatase MutT (NUDIX family)